MDIGTVNGGSTIANLSLVNATLGVTATSDSGWSTAAGVALSGENTIATSEGKPITLSGNISDGSSAGSLIAKGAGTLTLSGANTHTGGTYIWSGATVVAGSETALGSGDVKVEGELVLGTENVSVKNLSGNANGLVNLGDNTSVSTLTITSDEDTTFAGAFSEGGLPSNQSLALNIVKNGDAALTLSSTNGSSALTAPSTISVNAGTLVAASANAFGGGSTSYNGNVYSGATVSVANGATLKIAAESVYASSVTLAEGASLVVDFGTINPTMPASADADSQAIEIAVLNAASIQFGDTKLSSGDNIALPEGYVSLANADAFESWTKTWSYADDTLSLTLAIPEPSLFGLLAGLGALTLVGTRRRRGKNA